MMFGFMFSSIVGGQIMSRTGSYKVLALVGLAVAAFGMYLLAQMDVSATEALVIRNMLVTGLGLGVMMSLFTIVVQNAFPFSRLGQVTASLQFFRSIGGTIGVAILGTVMTNRFQDALTANLPTALTQSVPPERLALLKNPQVLLAPEATAQIQQALRRARHPGAGALPAADGRASREPLDGDHRALLGQLRRDGARLRRDAVPARDTAPQDETVPHGGRGQPDRRTAAGRRRLA